MAPYVRVPRQESSSSSNTTSTDSSSSEGGATEGVSSFMDAHAKEVYIALAVVAVIIVAGFIWAGMKHKLSFLPFNQKCCVKCKKGIAKSETVDKDYYANDKGKGWVCKQCTDKRTEGTVDGKSGNNKKDIKSKEDRKRRYSVDDDDRKRRISMEYEDELKEDRRRSRLPPKKKYESEDEDEKLYEIKEERRKSKAPPKKRYESEDETEYETDSEDDHSEDERDRKVTKERRGDRK
ncbi:uncharacterized protein IL334_007376 [Kwoniella shivajii]|uniref:Uncharacterized protein n=1 Tax=Kwoniella shivajii TaxID=564305 RepID=A0ABZ1D9A3_9TREE|nr:hypothetical protein IL334_007376 [Kwoniella shivajii]